MKLTSVEIHPSNSSDIAILSFRDPNSVNPYNVKAITGLDLDAIVPRHYGSSGVSSFYELTMQSRQIVLQVNLNPDYSNNLSYSDLRDAFYKMIASSRSGLIQLQFINKDDRVAAISGFVQKLETTMFEKTQGINVTIQCSDPRLLALVPDTVNVTGFDPANLVISDNKSTAPHGVALSLGIIEAIPSITISDPSDDTWAFSVVPSTGFLPDDIFELSSEYNNKIALLTRSGDTIQLADVIVPGSIWPIIFPGDNLFSFTYDPYVELISISYYPTYWGV